MKTKSVVDRNYRGILSGGLHLSSRIRQTLKRHEKRVALMADSLEHQFAWSKRSAEEMGQVAGLALDWSGRYSLHRQTFVEPIPV